MNKEKYRKIFLIGILILIGILLAFFPELDNKLEEYLIESETVFIDRVIDGDTVESNGSSIRLLGINTPEKGEKYYGEAKELLENLVLNKTVILKFGKEREDRYGRSLAYLYYKNENINLKIVEEGYANIYFPSGKDMNYNKFYLAWRECNKNLCEKSEDICANCISLIDLDYKKELIIFENICDYDCNLTNWEIKDEGRKKFVFSEFVLGKNKHVNILTGKGSNSENTLFWKNQNYVWTDSGDSLFLRDDRGKLVLFESY